MFILLELRDGNIIIPKREFEFIFNFEWFLGKLVTLDFDIKNETYKDKYILWESKDAVLSILDSIRYSKLIIHGDVNLDYLHALADKWCSPTWLIESILNEIDKSKSKSKFSSKTIKKNENFNFNEDFIFNCVNCNSGFKLNENFADSCKYHPCRVSDRGIDDQRIFFFPCCGHRPNNEQDNLDQTNSYCKVGYHVASIIDLNTYQKLVNNETETD